jgi:uncharacterized membrane protein SpoIIM required for sporulation
VSQTASSFRAEREAEWQRLEAMLKRIEGRGPRALNDEELLELPLLYRATLSSLSVARATVLDRALIDYLEALSLRAYLAIYGATGGFGKRLARFFLTDWPDAVRALWRETIVALLILAAGTAAGYLLVAGNPEWFGAIVGTDMAQGRGPHASAELLKSILYDKDHKQSELQFFATYLFTHNAQVSLACFALGFAFGVPTLMLVFYNGAALGAMLQIYAAKGLGLPMVGWLSIHGTTELFAIVLAAAAGLHIGTRMAFPGAASRLAVAKRAGRTAGIAMMGVIAMLVAAGLLEGIGRQTINTDWLRLTIGGTMLIFWLVFFYGPRWRTHGA